MLRHLVSFFLSAIFENSELKFIKIKAPKKKIMYFFKIQELQNNLKWAKKSCFLQKTQYTNVSYLTFCDLLSLIFPKISTITTIKVNKTTLI